MDTLKKAAIKGENIENIPINRFLESGDVLLIVPPFKDLLFPSPGVHLLQAIGKDAGLTVRVLYANLFFPPIIGTKLYQHVATDDSFLMGERLFTAAAFGLPPLGRNVDKLHDLDWVPDHIWQVKREIAGKKVPEAFISSREWLKSVDWEHMEALTAHWTDSMAKQIINMGFPVVGCSTTHSSIAASIGLLTCVKRANPKVITILGGALCDGEMAEGMLSLKSNIDYIFSGEGEITFVTFIRKLLEGNLPGEKFIHGEEVKNLDTTPLPNYTDYIEQSQNIQGQSGFTIPYETSRGCWFGKCTFCGLISKKRSYSTKSPDKIIEDLKQLVNQYPINLLFMTDTILPLEYFDTLLPRISNEIPAVCIYYELKANLTVDQVNALKKAGVTIIQPGIESLSPSLLRRMRKGVTVRENIALLRYARSFGINVVWNLLFGFPGDTPDEYQEMLRLLPLLGHLQPPGLMMSMRIFQFSKYRTSPEEFGISNIRPSEVYKDIFPRHANLDKLALYFAGDYKSRSLENPGLISALWKEFQAWRSQWAPYQALKLDFFLPTLHLERDPSGGFVLYDTRSLPGRPKKMVIDREQAYVLLNAHPGNSSLDFQWALDAKLGVFMDSWFIPLVTADTDILIQYAERK